MGLSTSGPSCEGNNPLKQRTAKCVTIVLKVVGLPIRTVLEIDLDEMAHVLDNVFRVYMMNE